MADSKSKIDWNALALPKVGKTSLPKSKDRPTRARRTKAVEMSAKQQVRTLDRYCRFPKCGCRRTGHALAVAHMQHKGAGGNPRGDRSTLAGLILLCAPRHRENPVSLDKGTLKITPLTELGTRGPCAWYVEVKALKLKVPAPMPGLQVLWFCVGIETAPHMFEPFTPDQAYVLGHLAAMTR